MAYYCWYVIGHTVTVGIHIIVYDYYLRRFFSRLAATRCVQPLRSIWLPLVGRLVITIITPHIRHYIYYDMRDDIITRHLLRFTLAATHIINIDITHYHYYLLLLILRHTLPLFRHSHTHEPLLRH